MFCCKCSQLSSFTKILFRYYLAVAEITLSQCVFHNISWQQYDSGFNFLFFSLLYSHIIEKPEPSRERQQMPNVFGTPNQMANPENDESSVKYHDVLRERCFDSDFAKLPRCSRKSICANPRSRWRLLMHIFLIWQIWAQWKECFGSSFLIYSTA